MHPSGFIEREGKTFGQHPASVHGQTWWDEMLNCISWPPVLESSIE